MCIIQTGLMFSDYNMPKIVFDVGSAPDSPPTYQPIVFSSVNINMGNGYSSSTGKFTAPVNGNYSLTAQLCIRQHRDGSFSLVLDGNSLPDAITNYHRYNDVIAADTVSLFLKQGQKVWVIPDRCSNCLTESGPCWNRFYGSLIHELRNYIKAIIRT